MIFFNLILLKYTFSIRFLSNKLSKSVSNEKKHVFDSEGMIAGMGWQTYALCVGFFFFIFEGRKTKNPSNYHFSSSVIALHTTVSIRIVADCVALSCQVTRKLKRATSLEFTTLSAIIFIHC